MTTPTATTAVTPGETCTPAQRVTRSLLGYGVLAGAVFEASILIAWAWIAVTSVQEYRRAAGPGGR
jgi:hypothetical protein